MDYDILKRGLVKFVRALVGNEIVGPNVDYLAAYPCKVATQNGDGTLELVPDDTRIPAISSAPIRYGIPGVTAQVANGARAMVQWAGGDPSKPFAEIWESGTLTALVIANGTEGCARNGDQITIAVGAISVSTAGTSSAQTGSNTNVVHGTITASSTIVKVG